MVLVDSEAVAEIRYDPASSTMQVRFVDGDWYTYFDVPPEVYRAFLAATSHGRFFTTTSGTGIGTGAIARLR